MKAFQVQMINLDLFFRYLKEVAMATNFVKKGQTALIRRFGFPNRYLNVCINNVNGASISCKNFVNLGPVTPELTELICELLVRYGKKLAYLVEYLRIYWTDFCNLFTVRKRFGCR